MNRTQGILIGMLCLFILVSTSSTAAPSTGTIEVAFILSQFNDQAFQNEHDKVYFEDLAFNETDSMWEYYNEVSKGELDIEGDIFGPYTLDNDAADYGEENLDFVTDSVEIADDDIDYRNYDAVMVIHSGPGQESTNNSNDIWSIHWPSANIETNDSDYIIKRITQAPEYQESNGQRNPLGVWCHEFGHELGLPDLYDTDGTSEGIGNWGLMAGGSWGNNGETPVYFSAWSRFWLDWIEPINVTGDINNLILEPIENGGKVYRLPIPGDSINSNEYFLIENRQQIKYDAYLPGEGLLIWHIDENVLYSKWNSNRVNRDEEHKGVDLEEADGKNDLDFKVNRGDAEDAYTSGSFGNTTNPNSSAYNQTDSGWKISNIEIDGDNIVLDVSFRSKPYAIINLEDGAEAVVTEGFELQFYGNESRDDDGNIVNYTWDFNDGNFSYIDKPKHIFQINGTYRVSLTVRDNHGLEDTYILTIFVNKPPITIVYLSEIEIFLGNFIVFDASDSYDVDGNILFFVWDFNDGYTSNLANVTYEYKNSGIYNVSLKIGDDLSVVTTTYYEIKVINKLPTPNFIVNPTTGDTETRFTFTDLSFDSDGIIESWLWNFDDSETSELQNPEHSFALPGMYNITLTIYDDQEGFNQTNMTLVVENALPNPNIDIAEGRNDYGNKWIVPCNREIKLDAGLSSDNENDKLYYYWTFEEQDFSEKIIFLELEKGLHQIELKVIDERGGEKTDIFELSAEEVPSLYLEIPEINILTNQEFPLQILNDWGDIVEYHWIITGDIYSSGSNFEMIYNGFTYNDTINISYEEEGNVIVNVSGKHLETSLWTEVYSIEIETFDPPQANFNFMNSINEGDWIEFDGSSSSGINLEFNWTLNGIPLAGKDEIISVFINSGGYHDLGLHLYQNPVGESYIEKRFYADSKPTEVINLYPKKPRVGDKVEIYLAANDTESEAVIEYIKIKIYDQNKTKINEENYPNQGSNFNIVFDAEYAGRIVLDYKLVDINGNIKESSSEIEILGWADVYIESFEIKGSKERGDEQNIIFNLKNFNENYYSDLYNLYNGYMATGDVTLFIDSILVYNWTFEIDAQESKEFSFLWTAEGGYHEFELIVIVDEGEKIIDNNRLNFSAVIDYEKKSGLLSYPPNILIISVLILSALFYRRKPN